MNKLTLPLFLLISLAARAQDSPAPYQSMAVPKGIIVCHGSDESAHTSIPPPEAYLASLRAGRRSRVQNTSTFEVTYENFPEDAKKACQRAMDIWSALITSNVPIKIYAEWQAMEGNTLASSGASTVHKNFPGAQREEVYYPAALANKMANTDLNGSTSEISMYLNSNKSWHYDPDTESSSSEYDLVSTILHEIGHGLGISSAYQVSNGNGGIKDFYQGKPTAYDLFLESANFTKITSYTPPSGDLANVLTSEALYFKSKTVTKNLNVPTGRGKVYAPSPYGSGALSHNDEDEYPSGNVNSMMTPSTHRGERTLDPGPITKGQLIDMGWGNPILTHTKVADKDSRANDINVVCKLVSGDSRYPPSFSTLRLYYIKNTEEPVSINMTATGIPDEYKATIPRPSGTDADTVKYAYYISVYDQNSTTFTWPGQKITLGEIGATMVYYKFKVDPIRPLIAYHTPLTRVRNTADMEITAAFKHEYGIENGFVDWKVNDNVQTRVTFEHVSDSTYRATLPLATLNLTGTDTIRYRITGNGNSTSNNTTAMPSASTYYEVTVVARKPVQERYVNNFDSQNTSDFWGDFTIAQPANFSNAAIQSPHPYEAAGDKTSINYTYELLTPIKVKEGLGTITFDEVVLVEPGSEGAVYGSPNFNDYVVVEGSADRGSTWTPVANGWDSGDKANWREAWNSQNNAGAAKVGNSNLYHRRSLNLLTNFNADDEVVLRFRLFSNVATAGWGWAIDNLAIQLQDGILHNHLDYVMNSTELVRLQLQVLDANAIKSISFKVKLNEQEEVTHPVDMTNKSQNVYQVEVPYPTGTLKKGDHINYRIDVTNTLNATTSLPSTGYYRIKVLDLGEPVINYPDITTDKFFGNFITTTQITIETVHPYPAGFGTNHQSSFSAILNKPIKLEAKRPDFTFKERLTLGANDYVQVEGSKDGVAWKSLSGQYTTAPTVLRTVSLFKDNEFKDGDVILLRFRLFSDGTGTEWGWKISDLEFKEVAATADNNNNSIILHNHLDYVMNNTATVRLQVQALNANAIQALSFKVKLNEQAEVTHAVDMTNKSQNVYQVEVPYANGTLKKGDHINYRIDVTNTLNATSSLPSTGYYRIEVLDLSEPVINYPDITTDKFFGNFITTTQTTIETAHPYAAGFGTNYQSEFSAILSKPVKLEAKRPNLTFKEKLVPGANDYVQVEGSKDGITWKSLSDQYTTAANNLRTVSFFKDNEFKEGDVILLRFRLTSDKTGTGWGWEISDLQFPENAVTAIEEKKEFSLFPNPVKRGDITVQVNAEQDFSAEVNDIYGRRILTRPFSGGTKVIKLPVGNLSPGLYLLSLKEGEKRRTIRFVKL